MSYIAATLAQQQDMLRLCGVKDIEELFADIPADLRPRSFSLPPPRSEYEVRCHIERLAARNYYHLINFIGGGFYDHYIPAAVDALVSLPEFYTSYTPYQPEISQGTLQAMYEYQTAICRLTNMEVANASLYDGGTALYEACQMALAITGRRRIVIDEGVNPIYRKMIYCYAANLNIEFKEVAISQYRCDRGSMVNIINDHTAAVVLQNPNFFGFIDDHSDIVEKCEQFGIITIQSVNPIAMAIVKTPGEQGFDIATGEGQPLGIPLSFGGPYLGFMATKMKYVRRMPGRIVGRTTDRNGKEGFVLTLQAREQHIRREKATSNICSNEALCALRALIYLSLLGPQGLVEVATECIDKAYALKQRLESIPGVSILESNPTFNEFAIRLPIDAAEVVSRMIERGFAAGFPLGRYYRGMENCLLVAVTEKRTNSEIGLYAEHLEDVLCQ